MLTTTTGKEPAAVNRVLAELRRQKRNYAFLHILKIQQHDWINAAGTLDPEGDRLTRINHLSTNCVSPDSLNRRYTSLW